MQQALDLLIENKLSQSSWFNHIAQMQNKFKNSIKEIIDYLQQLEADIEKSNIILENNTIEKAINTSVSYIKKCFNNNQWQDYYNQGGISNIWSSAFVLSKISSEKNLKKYFENEVKGATEFIISSKSFNNMWSYNSTWIDDADSTNFALISLFFTDNLVNYDYHNWIQFFNSEFFSTYNNSDFLLKSLADNHINNVQGWCSDHHCVSAVSLYFLTISNQHSDIKNKLLQNFKNLEFDNINAYWWTDNIYTLYYLFLSYKKLELNDEMEHIQNFIITKIKDGLYHDYYGENLFFSALALEILVNNENFKSIAATITESLLKKQFKDGSWQESNSLCIPMPNKINPINKNYEIKKIGVNVRSFEFNRLFTTTSILRSLNKWKDQN